MRLEAKSMKEGEDITLARMLERQRDLLGSIMILDQRCLEGESSH